MKKIEKEFLKEFDDSLGNQKSFNDIKDKINIKRLEKKKGLQNYLIYKKIGIAGIFMLLFAVAIPSVISIWNSRYIIESESGLNTDSVMSSGNQENSTVGGTSNTGGNSSIGSNTSSTLDGNNTNKNDTVKTIINTYEVSLPHHLAVEVNKKISIEKRNIDIDVFIGHPIFHNEVTFPEFLLTMQELENYKFALMINYNNEILDDGLSNIDYLNADYNITMSNINEMEIINFHKMHKLSLLTENMINKKHGFINVELYLISLQSSEKYIVSAATIFYSVTETEFVFGLVQNPVLHEGDDGVITNGWQYQESSDEESNQKYLLSIKKSNSTLFFSADANFDITNIFLLNSENEKNQLITDYTKSLYTNLYEILNNDRFDKDYFEVYSIVICPFVYSSSERDIELTNFKINNEKNSFDIYFSLYSPEDVDHDLWIVFFLIEIEKSALIELHSPIGRMQVLNNRDGSNRSAYYGRITN